MAARKNKNKIDMPEMEEAAERVIMGPERRSRVISDKEKRLTAYHEGGHTLVGMLLDNTDPVHKVTIIPRGACRRLYIEPAERGPLLCDSQ